MSPQKTDYMTSLNALRGLAALVVVLYHAKEVLGFPGHEIFMAKGYLAVDLFFILSGFVLMHVYNSQFESLDVKRYWKFITLRFARIYPVHVAVLLFWVGLECLKLLLSLKAGIHINEPTFAGRTSIFALCSNLFLVQAWHLHDKLTWNGPSWSISAEWFAYLLAPVLIGFFGRLRSLVKIGLSYMVPSILLWALAQSAGGYLTSTYDFGVLRMLFEFCMGIAVYKFYQRSKFKTNAFSFNWPFFLITSLMIAGFYLNFSDFWIVQIYALLIPCCALAKGFLERILSSKALFNLGDISYSLYMTHGIIVYVVLNKAVEILQPDTFTMYLLLTGTTVISSLGLATLSYHFLEIPARDFLRSRLLGRTTKSQPVAGASIELEAVPTMKQAAG